MHGYESFGMGLGGLGMILVWVVPLVLIFLLVRYFRGERRGKSALDILEERYARGEIDQEEYRQRRAGLGG